MASIPARVLLLAAALTSAAPAWANEPERPLPQEPRAAPAPPNERANTSEVPTLDFDLLGTPREKANPALEHAVETRRSMLTLHQGFGIATLAALAATVVVGQLDFNDRFRGGGDTGKYHSWHAGLAYGTSALFLTTGLLALFAPKPYPKPLRFDSALVHKIAMGTAAAGMIAQIVLGIVARGQAGSVQERDLAAVHQAIGYVTLGAMTVGVVAFTF
jgi:hypothetical protein